MEGCTAVLPAEATLAHASTKSISVPILTTITLLAEDLSQFLCPLRLQHDLVHFVECVR